MRNLSRSLLLATGLCAGVAAAAEAPGLSISPVRIDLSAGRKADAITVVNIGPDRKVLEAEVLAWSQVDGDDVYTPATDLRANPSRLVVEPGATQVVRVGLTRGALLPATTENAYRIYFHEVPQDLTDAGNQLRFVMKIGIPVFVRPAQPAKPELSWVTRRDNGTLNLVVTNRGHLHARLAEVRARTPAGDLAVEGFHYVLPGASVEWAVPQLTDPPLSVSALGERGRGEYSLEAPVR